MRSHDEIVTELHRVVALGLRAVELDVPLAIKDGASRARQLAWVLGHGEEITGLGCDELLAKLCDLYQVDLEEEGWR